MSGQRESPSGAPLSPHPSGAEGVVQGYVMRDVTDQVQVEAVRLIGDRIKHRFRDNVVNLDRS